MKSPTIDFARASGILLHPSSLPGKFGIGDLGPVCGQFIEFLKQTRQTLWQLYPLGPTGFGDSPYACFSAFAGNPLLVSPEWMEKQGWIAKSRLESPPPGFSPHSVNFGEVVIWKEKLFEEAFQNFQKDKNWGSTLEKFRSAQSSWLPDYALFMAIKNTRDGAPWYEWPQEFKTRDPGKLKQFQDSHATAIHFQEFKQHLFFTQWEQIKKRANDSGIKIIGDIPIFVAHDSADVWCHSDLFQLDKKLTPLAVAGVPPDYFSSTGQLWGNPLYDWESCEKSGFQWWISRIANSLKTYDILRIDHFRGFEAFWRVPFGEKTAVQGSWVKAPGDKLFDAVKKALPRAPIIAEDLGTIDEEVKKLRDSHGFPGMKILQFAFDGDPDNEYLPYNFKSSNAVVYTGTHDNDTLHGWFETLEPHTRRFVLKFLDCRENEILKGFLRAGMGSAAHTFIVPLQDLLGLGSEGRMNTPGKSSGNWCWRLDPNLITDTLVETLTEFTELFGRAPRPIKDHPHDRPK